MRVLVKHKVVKLSLLVFKTVSLSLQTALTFVLLAKSEKKNEAKSRVSRLVSFGAITQLQS